MEWKIIPRHAHVGTHSWIFYCLQVPSHLSKERRRVGSEKQGREPNWREMEGRQKNKNMSLEAHTEYSRADFDVCTHTQNAKSQTFGS